MKREADLAIKIDNLTGELSQLKGVKAQSKSLEEENSLLRQ